MEGKEREKNRKRRLEIKKEEDREIREGGRLRQRVLNLVAYSFIPGSGDNA